MLTFTDCREDFCTSTGDPGKTVVKYNFWNRAASKKCFLSPSCQSAGMDVSLTTLGTKSCNRVWFQTENLFYTQHVSSSSEHHKFHVTFGKNRDTKSKPRKTENHANQPAWFCPQLMIMQTLRVRKTSSACQHCCPESFCKNPESFQP